jgi:hypothetical protein
MEFNVLDQCATKMNLRMEFGAALAAFGNSFKNPAFSAVKIAPIASAVAALRRATPAPGHLGMVSATPPDCVSLEREDPNQLATSKGYANREDFIRGC